MLSLSLSLSLSRALSLSVSLSLTNCKVYIYIYMYIYIYTIKAQTIKAIIWTLQVAGARTPAAAARQGRAAHVHVERHSWTSSAVVSKFL